MQCSVLILFTSPKACLGLFCNVGSGCAVMAEELEDFEPEASSLSRDFHCHQLEIYKHQFRIGSIDAEETVIQQAFDSGIADCVPIAEKVGRLKGVLTACLDFIMASDDNAVRLLLADVNALLERFELKQFRFVEQLQEEATIETTPELGDTFNPVDMELLLGTAESESTATERNLRSHYQNIDSSVNVVAIKSELRSIADAFETLRDRCCDILHKLGICDRFLYGNWLNSGTDDLLP